MYYDRKIKYLDYLQNGERIRGGGFVKLEVRDEGMGVDVTVSGLHPTDTFVRDVVLQSEKGDIVLGRIEITGGRGKYRHTSGNLDDLDGAGTGYSEVFGLRIPLGAGRELSCIWRERGAGAQPPVSRKEEEPGVSHQAEENPQIQDDGYQGGDSQNTEPREKELQSQEHQDREIIGREIMGREILKQEPQRKEPQRKEPQRKEPQRKEPQGKESQRKEPQMPANLREDKWSQLWAIYPHIRPFQDEREYLSIGPADFVLFSTASYKMVNNSFLLHGYYNYDHLILAQMEKKGELLYYIGVPGSFFEKEKQVAIMFGFESFECAEGPAQAGDFGYYMMRTEL